MVDDSPANGDSPANDASPPKADRAELAELMRRMHDHMRRRFHDVVGDHGLTPPLYATLRTLDGPMPMGAAAERLCFDASYLTAIADRLEAMELIERLPDPDDRRVKRLAVTERGIEVKRRIDEAMSMGAGMFPELDNHDVRDLVRVYRKLLADVD